MDIKNFVETAKVLPCNISVLIRGNHGIGKSRIVYQLGDFFELRTIERRLSQMSEGDMIGLPELKDGVTRFCPPDWFMQAFSEPVVLFLDELNRATPEVMQAAFQIVLDREMNGHRLHEGTRVFAAINNSSNYQVNEMDPALLDRFYAIDLDPNVEDWLKWAKDKVNDVMYDFIKAHSSFLDPNTKSNPGDVQPSRRSWERFDKCLAAVKLYEADMKQDIAAKQQFYNLGMGLVGKEAANAFIDYAKNLDNQITAEDILDNWDKVSKKVEKLGQEKWNICISKLVEHMKKKVVTEKQAKNVGKFVGTLPGELRVNWWTSMAATDTTEQATNIKVTHPFVSPHILNVYGKEAPKTPAKK